MVCGETLLFFVQYHSGCHLSEGCKDLKEMENTNIYKEIRLHHL